MNKKIIAINSNGKFNVADLADIIIGHFKKIELNKEDFIANYQSCNGEYDLNEDVGIDSLEMVCLFTEIEVKYNLKNFIEEEDGYELRYVRNLINYVNEQLLINQLV